MEEILKRETISQSAQRLYFQPIAPWSIEFAQRKNFPFWPFFIAKPKGTTQSHSHLRRKDYRKLFRKFETC